MEDQRNGRPGTRARVETAFETALWTRENDFRHGCAAARVEV